MLVSCVITEPPRSVLAILLIIGGVETNPGHCNKTGNSSEGLEEKLGNMTEMIKKIAWVINSKLDRYQADWNGVKKR